MSKADDTLGRIEAHPGVNGVMVVTREGGVLRTNMDVSSTQLYASRYQHLIEKAHIVVREMDPRNELQFLRVRTRKYEVMVAPQEEFILLVTQNPVQAEELPHKA